MSEDKLTRSERVRLESLSQAINVCSLTFNARPTTAQILSVAEEIESWLLKAGMGVN